LKVTPTSSSLSGPRGGFKTRLLNKWFKRLR
jgi:hypothetical protein